MTNYTELKKKQRAAWALGEYDRIADGLTISTDQTLRVAKLRPGERVLDVATGTGITALAARGRGARVSGVDFVPELLAVAREKAEAEGFNDIDFREGDAEALPFGDASFDVVLSTCGHMFAPDQPKVAAELARVTRPGGRVVFLAWTPEGGLGGWFRVMNKHVPPPGGAPSPFNWGEPDKVRQLLRSAFRDLAFTRGDCPQFGASPEEIWELFSTRYGPTVRVVVSLQGEALTALRRELLAYLDGYRAADGKVRWGREYLITRAIRA
ncbi:MAG TPA: methyltransferase domain-containing protein [Burkholderiales bacterium]|nr:methyltransferase domain-containing protein [Burkholderiales bacterium]